MTARNHPPDQGLDEHSRHYALVARAIDHLRAHHTGQPSLQVLAQAMHTSPAHLQRVFCAWAGLSPKRFLQHLTMQGLREQLRRDGDLIGTAMDAGLSGTSRLHDLTVSCEGMTPGELKTGGAGTTITHGIGPTPFGTAEVAWTARGVCHLTFFDGDEAETGTGWRASWPRARVVRDDAAAAQLLAQVFPELPSRGTLHLVLRGTNFQLQVWQALLRTRPGQLLSYSDLARTIGKPRAQRAVGRALATNTVAWLIPCHRVIRESGDPGNYRWGPTRKLAMLGWEAGRRPGLAENNRDDALPAACAEDPSDPQDADEPRSSQRSTTA